MKKLLLGVFGFVLFINGYSQMLQRTVPDNDTIKSIEPALEYFNGTFTGSGSPLPSEKIFLHLDRLNYVQGDTIWFKAYAWFGFDQLPDTVNKVLYVDLLSTKDSVLIKRKLLIHNGTSMGEFILDKDTEPGQYQVRASTRWMQNDNTGEPFYQRITIGSLSQNFQVDCTPIIIRQNEGDSLKVILRFYEINEQGELKNEFNHRVDYRVRIGDQLLNTERALSSINSREQVLKFPLPGKEKRDSMAQLDLSIKEAGLEYNRQFLIPLEEGLDLQFFPESGTLISGLEARVAFKAIGSDGLGEDVKGVIKTENGDVITPFESSRKGMGDFYFTPESGKKYQAYINFNHRELRFNFPDIKEQGCIMAVEKNDSAIMTIIRYTASLANTRMVLAGSAYGKLRFIAALKLSPDSCMVKIPFALLPEGIARLTLMDDSFKPLCERLIYCDRKERFKVEIKADSASYGTRSKVILHIRTTTQNGEPVPANLSLSVTDKELVKDNDLSGGISAYKLLKSELKGSIEDPGFYFRGDSVNYKAMELLMLTQGYRRFTSGNPKPPEIRYYPERSFDISGRVALRGDRKKGFDYRTLGLTLLCPSDKTFFDQAVPDSTGHFSFQVPLQEGQPLSLLRAYTANGKLNREKLPKEKSFKGDILLNEVIPPHFTSPFLTEITTTSPLMDWVQQLQTAKKNEFAKIKNGDKWHLSLPEVTITAKAKRDKDWYTRYEEEAKKIVDMDSIDPTGRKYDNLYDVLVREFGARKCYTENREAQSVLLPCLNMDVSMYYPVYVLNGQTFCNSGEDSLLFVASLRNLYSIKVNEIKRLLVLPPVDIVYHYSDPNVLSGSITLKGIFNERVCPYGCHSMKQSMVVIETYSKKNFYRGDPDGLKTFILDGLDTPRIFYSPWYEGLNRENPNYDGRATLYWKPFIRTNQKGESEVEFYTGDRKMGLEVTVNGIQLRNGATGEATSSIKR